MQLKHQNSERLKRSRVFYAIIILIFGSIFMFLFIALQSLILPVLIGAISAYIASPLLNILMSRGIPKGVGVLILFSGFILLVYVVGKQVVEILPNEKEQLELRISVQYKINEIYLDLLGKKSFIDEGNFIDAIFGKELSPVLSGINGFLRLNDEDEANYFYYKEQNAITQSVIKYHDELQKVPQIAYEIIDNEPTDENVSWNLINTPDLSFKPKNSRIAALLAVISNWLVTPFVFVFLLFDEGEIKRFFVKIIPNRYFEMALTTIANVDRAIGQYLRGTLLQSTLVAISFIIGLLISGFELKAATLIGIVAGIANAIPFLGPAIGLIVGVLYAMVVENIDPLIPLLSSDYAVILVLITVGVVQLLDNAVFSPLILGKAVNLHPLIVIIGVAGGSIIFGFVGMLFAIPAIVIVNVIFSTIYRQLKDYYIIY